MQKHLRFVVIQLLSLAWAAGASADWYKDSKTGEDYFKVERATETLTLIGLQVYGRAAKWRDIAAWNNIQAPYWVRMGQIIALKDMPKGTIAESRERVLAYNRKKQQLTTAAITFEKDDPGKAFASIEQAVKTKEKPESERAPAAAESDAPETLSGKSLLWLESEAAEAVYLTLKDVPEKPFSRSAKMQGVDASACNQKVGVNVMCIRCPVDPPSTAEAVQFQTRCAGFSADPASPSHEDDRTDQALEPDDLR